MPLKQEAPVKPSLSDVGVDDVPSVLFLDTNRIKTCLYREQENMARLKPPALQLIATTTALFLRSLVVGCDGEFGAADKNTTEAGADVVASSATPLRQSKRRRTVSSSSATLRTNVKAAPALVTLETLRQNVKNNPTALEFLSEPLRQIKDRSPSTPYQSTTTTTTATAAAKRKSKKAERINPLMSNKLSTDLGNDRDEIAKLTAAAASATTESQLFLSSSSRRTIQEDDEDYD
ncbi:hypothetical protein IV203_024393 [Nitzschia inconspicua]|uniref:Uncharacterized protein n=1 Tax=Nitzschia inconspicua TaxID=303405 RepID=A0A9K3KBY0_9STRA|nr:hypothetical protein IV203_024393 [Nitzschia inconspicua]